MSSTLLTAEIPDQLDERKHSQRPKKIGFVSLGCPKNLVDSEVMMGLLKQAGAELTSNAEEADVIVVNTCSFIDCAKRESVDTILEMARLKAQGRARKLVVAGCLVERYRDEIQKNIPEVDAVIGTGELARILAATDLAGTNSPHKNLQEQRSPFVILPSRPEAEARWAQGRFSRTTWDGASSELPTYLYNETTPRMLTTPKYCAYIKIAEGCDHPCSFCIIPQLRGKFRSRAMASVMAEAERLVCSGVREITLVGQDTTCYGEDLGLEDGLAFLLKQLAAITDLQWIRFLYAYPNKITPRLLETIAKYENICSYIDVPLQHASPSILRRMKRGGGAEVFLRSIERMRRIIPNLVLRTSFIVGFPGESEPEFEQLCDFVRHAEFDWMGTFAYSDEEGAAAYSLDGKLPAAEIGRRRKELLRVQRQVSRKKKKALVGKKFRLLLEGPSLETALLLEGRTEMHAPDIDGKVFINDVPEGRSIVAGEFFDARITAAHDYDLIAEIL